MRVQLCRMYWREDRTSVALRVPRRPLVTIQVIGRMPALPQGAADTAYSGSGPRVDQAVIGQMRARCALRRWTHARTAPAVRMQKVCAGLTGDIGADQGRSRSPTWR